MHESQSKFNSTLFRQTNNHDKSARDFVGHKSGNSSLIRNLECVRLIVLRNKNAKKSCYAMNLLYRDFWNTLGFILCILIPENSQSKTPLVPTLCLVVCHYYNMRVRAGACLISRVLRQSLKSLSASTPHVAKNQFRH